MKTKQIKIFLDFDGTLAYKAKNFTIEKIGPPIKNMVDLLNNWLKKGYLITIFTARVGHKNPFINFRERLKIKRWLKQHNLPIFPITAIKRHGKFDYIIDDKSFNCLKNKGLIDNNIPITTCLFEK